MLEFMPLILFAAICIVLMFGFPVALSLAGTALLFAGMGLGLEAVGIDANFDSETHFEKNGPEIETDSFFKIFRCGFSRF